MSANKQGAGGSGPLFSSKTFKLKKPKKTAKPPSTDEPKPDPQPEPPPPPPPPRKTAPISSDTTLSSGDIRELITKLAQRCGSLRELARITGISPSGLSEVATGKKQPGPKLMKALGVERRILYVVVRQTIKEGVAKATSVRQEENN